MGHVANKHDGELPFNQSKNKYETNYISETIGRGHGRRGRIEYSFRAGNFNYNHNYGGHNGREREHDKHEYA